MKNSIRIVSTILAVLLFLTSCAISPDDTATTSIPLPIFGGSSSGRGLKTMPVEYFEGDQGLACAVMSLMPTMTNLEAVEINVTGKSLENIGTSFTVFGFDIELVRDSSHINADGVYLQYRVLYEGSTVGFCDYYYNIEKKMFSYRQSVICTFEGIYDNEILNMEYIDIPVDNPLEPVFKVGQLTQDGTLDDNAYVDNIWLNTQSPRKPGLVYKRSFITLNEVRGKDGLYTMYAFKQLDNAFEMGPVDFDGEFSEFKTILGKYLDEDLFIDTDEERTKADLALIEEIYPLVYKNGTSIADHHSTIKGYSSYKEFVNDSFREQTVLITDNGTSSFGRTSSNVPAPAIYTYNGKDSTGASTIRNPRGGATNIIMGPSFRSLNGYLGEAYSEDKGYTLLGFKDYFGAYDSGEESVTVSDFTTDKFLRACGIDNEDYIKAFIAVQNETAEPDSDGRIRVEL